MAGEGPSMSEQVCVCRAAMADSLMVCCVEVGVQVSSRALPCLLSTVYSGQCFKTRITGSVVSGGNVEEEVRRHDSKEEVTPLKGTVLLGFDCHSVSFRAPYPLPVVSAGS